MKIMVQNYGKIFLFQKVFVILHAITKNEGVYHRHYSVNCKKKDISK